MIVSEKLELLYRRLLNAADGENESSEVSDFFKKLKIEESLPDFVRYFTTRLDEVISRLRLITTQIKPPGQFVRIENPQAWSAFAWALIEHKLPYSGRDLFAAMYDFQLSQQSELRRRLYKGVSLLNLGWANYLTGESAASRKAGQYALVEEIINTLDMDEPNQLRVVSANPAYLFLRQTYKIPIVELDGFIRFSRYHAKKYPDRCAYPEDCYVAYLRALAVKSTLFSADNAMKASHFNYSYFTMLLDLLGRSPIAGAGENFLADLVCYLFATSDGFQLCEHDNSSNTEGFNLIARIPITQDRLISELGDYIAADWRYWSKEVTAAELYSLSAKLRSSNIEALALFVRDFESFGDVQRLKWVVQQIYQQDRVKILIFTQANLVEVEKRQTNFFILLKAKTEELRFKRAVLDNMIRYAPKEEGARERIEASALPVSIPNPAPIAVQPPPSITPPQSVIQPISAQAQLPSVVSPSTVDQFSKTPRLVIRSTSSGHGSVGQKSVKPPEPKTVPKYTADEKSIEIPILKPCTSCGNPTSLTCKKCTKPFCNVHVNMSEMLCESCLKN